ncbi:patatin-like phospholipase family protein [Hoyosella altamirensis]|uniref:NTE family protein n=1 Tax=Hoyosella altamirensis TaxID=616997 RepID=A0A839RSD4_9ACTN|nr:patatin-like phospholipase family protein [Hoyosella altamirensis]MBB3038843.1 NTE family protein [Hoyosella altamirensis]
MTVSERPQRRGLIIGCGGTLGAAWIVAALTAVRDVLNWDPRDAELLMGTSAGAELVTMLGSGVSVDELVAMQLGTTRHPALVKHLSAAPGRFPPVPALALGAPSLLRKANGVTRSAGLLPRGRGNAAWLTKLANRLTDGHNWVPHSATWLVAADAETGTRVAFGSPQAPHASISDALRASWAIPGWFPPVRIGGRSYIDGGAVSTASVDLALNRGLEELVVLAPMASAGRIPARGAHIIERAVLRNAMSARLDQEIALAESQGIRVLRVDASAADLDVMGPNFMDGRRRLATFEHALRSTRNALEAKAGVLA